MGVASFNPPHAQKHKIPSHESNLEKSAKNSFLTHHYHREFDQRIAAYDASTERYLTLSRLLKEETSENEKGKPGTGVHVLERCPFGANPDYSTFFRFEFGDTSPGVSSSAVSESTSSKPLFELFPEVGSGESMRFVSRFI